MTTAAVGQPATVRPPFPAVGQSATLAIPLAEFGRALSDADLDQWLEDFAARNAASGHTYAISGKGVLLIMPPTGDPGSISKPILLPTWFSGPARTADSSGGLPPGSSCPTARATGLMPAGCPRNGATKLGRGRAPFRALSPISSQRSSPRLTAGRSWLTKSTTSCAMAPGWPG